jgi:imidazolonepropionase-like amidohydrolase
MMIQPRTLSRLATAAGICLVLMVAPVDLQAQVAVRGETVYTMAGEPIKDGVIVIRDGKITAIGAAAEIRVPEGFETLSGKTVTPGLVDAHSVVGLSGILNAKGDQDQLDASAPVQPELRALDAYNAHEELIEWIRSFGVTTVHTGHAPGELISGQTMVVKTTGNTVEDCLLVKTRAIAVTLTGDARKEGEKSPGTRGKMISMLRKLLIEAREYRDKRAKANDDESSAPARSLQLELMAGVLDRKIPLMVTADKAQDISSTLRLAKEFEIDVWLDSASEAYLLIDEIRDAGVPVLIHPTMYRASEERENLSVETASKLVQAGIRVALQSGYEPYVPKTRVVLFEAALAAANGLTFEQALATITIDAAKILGVADRVGSLEIGKDGDLAIFDGDPFEYTSHCVGVVIDGKVVSREKR